MKKFLKGIVRFYLLITGFIPYILFLKPRFFFVSKEAKKTYKKNKGAILVANHTSIMDYYCFLYKYAPRKVPTIVAEVVYKSRFVSFLNSVMGNIRVDRTNNQNLDSIQQAICLLNKKKLVLVFPEGKIEDDIGNFTKFNPTFAFLALKTGKPIIPFYMEGHYGLFKRPRVIVGEKIDPTLKEGNTQILDEEVNELSNKTFSYIEKLKSICEDHRYVKTKTIFTKRYWFHDFARITSIPMFYLVFPSHKIYLGSRKKIREALKYNALICGNHYGPCDPMFIYMYMSHRRSRIIATEEIFNVKVLHFLLTQSGVIKYRRETMKNSMDLIAFKQSLQTLNGRGIVALFPEGHINYKWGFDDSFKEGAATLSLMTNSPIVPFIFVEAFKYFRWNRIVIGDPIYPSDYLPKNYELNVETINKYNDIIHQRMKELYDYSLTKRRKHYGKRRYFYSPEESDEENISNKKH